MPLRLHSSLRNRYRHFPEMSIVQIFLNVRYYFIWLLGARTFNSYFFSVWVHVHLFNVFFSVCSLQFEHHFIDYICKPFPDNGLFCLCLFQFSTLFSGIYVYSARQIIYFAFIYAHSTHFVFTVHIIFLTYFLFALPDQMAAIQNTVHF